MTKCPYCGSDEGYYMTETIKRDLYFTFEDEPNYASDDSPVYIGTRKRCAKCRKVLPKRERRRVNDSAGSN